MRDEDRVIHICAGFPRCELKFLAAEKQCKEGCPLCRHIVFHADGTETEYQRKPN
jgi:hypothetical protein